MIVHRDHRRLEAAIPVIREYLDRELLLTLHLRASGATGTFSTSSTTGESDEQPVHTVTLTRPYSINTYEVTNDQFAAVMNEALDRGWVTASTSTVRNGSGNQQEFLDVDDGDCRIDYTGGELAVNSCYGDHPVTKVTWYGAVAFAYYLNELEGKEQTYSLSDWSVNADAAGYRLPSEAEWEYAAQGGANSGGYTYAGRNTAGDVAWYTDNSGSTTHTVGTKEANEIWTYDMSGNVWEWVQDWYGSTYYSSSPGSDPEGPASGSYRVLRGGSWSSSAQLFSSRSKLMKRTGNLYERICDYDNLHTAFYRADRGKRGKSDVLLYSRNLDENLRELRKDLLKRSPSVGDYRYFTIHEPKERVIFAASFPERVLRHAIMNVLEPELERFQIHESYACRAGKSFSRLMTDAAISFGAHRGSFSRIVRPRVRS